MNGTINWDKLEDYTPEQSVQTQVQNTPPSQTGGAIDWNSLPDYTPTFKTKDDFIAGGEQMDAIRRVMVAKNGVDYETLPNEKVVEDFLDYQRYLEAGNEVSLTKEMLFINRADPALRTDIATAYKAFEELGTISQTGDYADGITDYIEAVFTAPSTYVGLGVGSLLSRAGSKAASLALRKAVQEAAEKAVAQGTASEAAQITAAATIKQSVGRQATNNILKRAGAMALTEAPIQAALEDFRQRVRAAGETETNVSFQELPENYSVLSTTLAGGLGAVGGAAGVVLDLLKPTQPVQAFEAALLGGLSSEAKKKLDKELGSGIAQALTKALSSPEWIAEAAKGEKLLGPDSVLNPKILDTLLNGNDALGVKGITDFMWEANYKPSKDPEVRWVGEVANFMKGMSDDVKNEIAPIIEKITNGVIKNIDELASSFVASARKAGIENSVFSKSRTAFGRKRIASNGSLGNSLDEEAIPLAEAEYEAYFQNLWKRLLVSNVKTTAANVAGSGIYAAGTFAQDMLNAAGYFATGRFTQAGKYIKILSDRARYLFNDDLNQTVFRTLLESDPQLFAALRKTTSFGIGDARSLDDQTSWDEFLKQYKFDQKSEAFKKAIRGAEYVVDKAQLLTLVRFQDNFFKAFGLMDSLNKQSRLKTGRSLDDVILAGEFKSTFTPDDIGRAVHDTLKLAYSADYTSKNKLYNEVPRQIRVLAETVERISNTPGLGFILPFGRFMNNVIANTYHFTPLLPMVVDAARKGSVQPFTMMENWTKTLVGASAITAFAAIAEQKKEQGTPWNIMDTGSGQRVDITNVYPLSYMALAGEIAWHWANGERVPSGLVEDFGKQIVLAQAAQDLQFKDQIDALLAFMINGEGDASIGTALGRALGSVVGGFTRPLQFVDDAVAFSRDDLQPVDRRQANGFVEGFANESTRYVERIFNAISSGGRSENEFRRQATRDGRIQAVDFITGTFTGAPVMQPRTYAEKMFEMAGKPTWLANFYSDSPEFDRIANEIIAPRLEQWARSLIKSEQFINMTPEQRRTKVEMVLEGLKTQIVDEMKSGVNTDFTKTALVRSIARTRERYPDRVEGAIRRSGLPRKSLRDMTLQELQELEEAIKDFERTVK